MGQKTTPREIGQPASRGSKVIGPQESLIRQPGAHAGAVNGAPYFRTNFAIPLDVTLGP